MSLSDLLFGRRSKNKRVDLLNQGQQNLLESIIERAMSGSGGFGFDEEFFEQNYVNPALRQFESRIAPSIQQKFIGAGAGRGSNLQDALTRAGADVQGSLDKQRAELLNQALNRQLETARLGLGTQAFANQVTPGTTGLLQEIASGIGGGFSQGFGQSAGQSAARGVQNFVNRGFRR